MLGLQEAKVVSQLLI